MARAKDQLMLLKKQIADVQDADPTRFTVVAQITAITNASGSAKLDVAKPIPVTLTVRAKLGGFGTDDLKVALAGPPDYKVSSISAVSSDANTFEVTFMSPSTLPVPTVKLYRPELVIQDKTRIESAKNVKLEFN